MDTNAIHSAAQQRATTSRRIVATLAICSAAMLLASAAVWAGDDPAPVFSNATYEKALAENKTSGKMLVVKATAVWCGPCKIMDKTTFRDEKIVKWFADNGVVIQLDVDKEKDTAAALQIEAMPTMIAFKNGKEVDRVVGLQKPEEFLPWLEAAKRGEKSSDKLMTQLADVRAGKIKMSAQERLQLAGKLMRAKQFDEATTEYLWLWDNLVKLDMSMSAVRVSFMTSDMQRLAAVHKPALDAFRKLRDETVKKFKSDTDVAQDDFIDWCELNNVIGDDQATLAWFDRVKDQPAAKKLLRIAGLRVARLLEQSNRWADRGKLYNKPADELGVQMRGSRGTPPGLSDDQKKEFEQYQMQSSRRAAAVMYASLLAATREDDATEVAKLAMKEDPSGDMAIALVQFALKADQPRSAQLDILAAAEKGGTNVAELRAELEKALKK